MSAAAGVMYFPVYIRPGRDEAAPRSAWATCRVAPAREKISQCLLLDLGEHCALRESVAGYAKALADVGVQFVTHLPISDALLRAVIVPAATVMEGGLAPRLSALVEEGTRLLLESGAGFSSPSGFRAHRDMLIRYFGLEIKPTVHLWPETGPRRVPYVDYVWPVETRVRDFSRVAPLSAGQPGEIIGWAEGMPVALKRNAGKGTLVFLGSPLGPSLLAGDLEARRWLARCIGVA